MLGVHVIIRDAAPDDAKVVMELQEQLFPDDPITLQESDFLADKDSVQILVAVVDDEIVGFGVLRNRPYRPWTGGDFLGVRADYRRHGIGRRLLEYALRNCKRPFFRLFVSPNNTNAYALYKDLGFYKTSVRKENYPDGEDALVMMRLKNFDFLG